MKRGKVVPQFPVKSTIFSDSPLSNREKYRWLGKLFLLRGSVSSILQYSLYVQFSS